MPQFVNKQTGRLVNLEGADGLNAVAAGTHEPVAGTLETELGGVTPADYAANIQGGLSNPEAVDPQAQRALEQQLHFEELYGDPGNAALAFGEGVAGGLTFGGSDVLLDYLGADTAERATANPGARLAGELGGAAVGTLAGGAGALGAAARLTPAGMAVAGAGRVGKALGGGAKGLMAATALEGAAFGAGTSLSQLVIHDVPLTSEAALPEIGLGTLLGAGTGLVGGALATGIGKVAAKLESRAGARTGKNITEAVNPFESEQFTSFAHDAKAVTGKFNQAADDALDTAARIAQGSPVTGSPGQLRKWATQRHELLNEKANEVIAAARNVNLGEPTIASLNKAVRDSTKLAQVAEGVKVLDSASYSTANNSLNRLEGQLRKVVDRLDKKLGTTGSWKSLAGELDALDDQFHALTGSGQIAPRTGRALGGVARKADPELGALVDEVKQAQREFRASWGLTSRDTLNETAFRQFANLNQEQALQAGTSWVNYSDVLKRLATKLPDQELAATVAQHAEEFTRVLKKLAPTEGTESAMQLMEKLGLVAVGADAVGVDVIPDLPGPADELMKLWLLGRFANRGAGGVVGKHTPSQLGRLLAGPKAVKSFENITKGVLSGAGHLATITGKALARIENVTSKLARGVEKVSRKGAPGATTILNKARFWDSNEVYTRSDDMYTAFQKRSTELARAAANPLATHQKVFDALTEVRTSHPLVADQLEMNTVRAVQFLHEKMPKDPGTVQSFGKSRWKPSEQEIIKWANYIGAVQDPLGVLENATNGVVTPQSAEALRTVYPRLFQEAQLLLLTRAEELQKNTTFEQQGRLSILFGVPVNSAYRPEMLKFNTAQWAARSETENPIDTDKFKPEPLSDAQNLI